MSDLFEKFSLIHKNSLQGSDTSAIPEKYLNAKKLYDRFMPVMNTLKNNNLKKGIDFGCGVGAATVLAKLMNIEITGVDIPLYKDIQNPYHKVHVNLQNAGFPIKVFDTASYPWNFKDNEFQFLLGFCSIGKDNSPGSVKDKNDMDDPGWANNRISELIRISHRKSVWYLGPKSTITFIRKNSAFRNRQKTIMLKEWPL